MKFSYHYGDEQGLRGNLGPIIIGSIFIVLLVLTGFNFFYRSKNYTTGLIKGDLVQLRDIFMRIDKKCKITGFDYQKNHINFLNVATFEGSEVGAMNLAYPSQWEGAYLDDNPTLQGIEYQIVRTKKGYFIVPGDGVMLPNGKVIGKDIVLDEDANIAAMMHDPAALSFKGIALACALPLQMSSWQKVLIENTPKLLLKDL